MRSKFKWIFSLILAFSMQLSFAQEKTVTGVVTDKLGPLPGANVVVKGSTNGVQTDFDGKYSIKAKAGDVLQISFTGYDAKSVTVGSASTYNVVLSEGVVLDEVVVVAYGSESKTKVTGAVSTVKAKSIEQVPIASLDQVLQGNVAGVSISVGSGQPGQSGTIRIRGTNSINGEVEPLFIIDGVPVDGDNFRSLNANDIENVSVLKDASTAALYGSRGAGGVVIVSTKKGKFNSEMKVQYRSLYGISLRPEANFKVLGAKEFLTYQRDVLGAGYGATGSSGSVVGSGPLSDAEIDAISLQSNTNWSNIFFRQGTTKSHEINLSSGSENSRNYTSIGYFEQEGITLNSNIQRFTFRTNFDTSNKSKFHFGYNLTFNYSKNNFVVDANRGANTGGELDNPFIVPYIGLPYQSAYNPDGTLNIIGTQLSGAFNADGSFNANNANGFQNTPYLALNTLKLNTDSENEIKAVAQINGDYKLLKNVKIGSSVGIDYQGIESLNITSPNSIRGQISPTQTSVFKGDQSEGFFRDAAFNVNTFITYSNTFKENHSFELSGFTEYYYNSTKNSGFTAFGLNPALPGSGSGFTNPSLLEGGLPIYSPSLFSANSEFALFSYFGLAKYDYKNKFGLQASIRRDASSRFLKENQWGTFWSLSGRWSLEKEKFLQNFSKLDELKLRASYGSVGNQSIGGAYVGQETIVSGNGYGDNPSYNPTFVDPSLKWETTTQLNFGLDFSFFQRLRGSVDLYNKKTTDLFLAAQLPPTVGFGSVNQNVGSLTNKGIELDLNYDLIKNNDWNVSVFFNGAYNKNEIVKLDGVADFIGTGATRLEVGEQLFSYNLVRWAGVDPSNGQPLYYDVNGNITNQYNLATDRVKTGKSTVPKYTGGFGLNISYKDFSFSSLFSYAAEQYRLNSSLGVLEDPSLAGFSNQSVAVLDGWKNPGDISSIPGVQYNAIRNQLTTRYLEDASFLRLRNVTLGYVLRGSKINDGKYFDSIRFTLQAQNMFTWTKYRGFDPESNQTANFFDYPTARQFTFGIDINL